MRRSETERGYALSPGDAGYPRGLLRLPNPMKVHCRGHWERGPERTVAIVGTRSPTRRGVAYTEALVRAFAQAASEPWAVVSGLAKGIDAAAHQTALVQHLPTAAVLGCGVDIAYPPAHRRLMEDIARQGALISEYPEGTTPRRGHFPRRNRLIAALARAVFVIEAGLGSGALHTATFARRLGIPVWVPLPLVGGPEGEGLRQLIQLGAIGFDSVEEALHRVAPTGPASHAMLAGELAARNTPDATLSTLACPPQTELFPGFWEAFRRGRFAWPQPAGRG